MLLALERHGEAEHVVEDVQPADQPEAHTFFFSRDITTLGHNYFGPQLLWATTTLAITTLRHNYFGP